MARPRIHDDVLRTRLLEHASRALSEHGAASMSLRTVTAAAGTTTAAVYTLFGSRDGLIAAVVDEGFERFGRHLAAVPRTDDPGSDLFALGLAYRESALADPHFYRVMFAAEVVPRLKDTLAEPTFGVLRDAVARLPAGATGGEGPDQMALRLWGLAHGLVSLELAGLLPGDAAEHAHRYAEALRPAPARG
ncbi:TetR/AcrR family transcriptional regulator [Occultella glacieicola]|uniref:TetR/AcrR family transcriptional regulator n=1 Tax=Occultella glacieicola TaxID=2518684 RepID=A0ABY2E019_9MICO|nr:TetR-like C-terminal domain-containing protein [Occultella glacieicola]TDE90756.1 TetR/AcrR family transcriptional regulator [Occultella glacieicola]